MFNKSTLFNRNDPIPRREASSTQPGSAQAAGAARPAGTANESTTTGRPATPPAKESSAAPAGTPGPSATPTAPAPPREKPASSGGGGAEATESEAGMGARLIVGPDVKLKGAEILDCDTLVVEGRVEATMDSRVIRIAERGSFVGKVSIDVAEIHGTFEGELTARAQLIIHSTGRVTGTIRYGKLVADEGGELCGDVAVLSAGHAGKAKPAAAEPALLVDSNPG